MTSGMVIGWGQGRRPAGALHCGLSPAARHSALPRGAPRGRASRRPSEDGGNFIRRPGTDCRQDVCATATHFSCSGQPKAISAGTRCLPSTALDPPLRLPRPAEAGVQSMRRAAGTQVTSALTPQSFDGRRWVGHAINEMRPESLRPAISFHAACTGRDSRARFPPDRAQHERILGSMRHRLLAQPVALKTISADADTET